MANKDAAFGFRPVRHLTGGLIRTNEYAIAANLGHNIFLGQCVKAVTGGGIERADAGDVILGVFGGCFYTDPTTSKPTFANFYPASTNASDIVANVYDDPRIVFEVQHDGAGGTVANNFAGFDFVGQGGSTISGRSSQELDSSENATSGQFKQIGISKDPNNKDVSSDNANVYVIPNVAEHSYLLTTALA